MIGKAGGGHANGAIVYKHLGSMATIGRYKALVDLRHEQGEFYNLGVWRALVNVNFTAAICFFWVLKLQD
jgi:hypothetical protein